MVVQEPWLISRLGDSCVLYECVDMDFKNFITCLLLYND